MSLTSKHDNVKGRHGYVKIVDVDMLFFETTIDTNIVLSRDCAG